jgi:iron complex outermembrane recepter protein
MQRQTKSTKHHFNHGVAYSALGFAALWVSMPLTVAAQVQPQPPSAQSPSAQSSAVETVVVTGSRIQRRDAQSLSPLLTITGADLRNSGAASIGDVLQRLPSAGVSLNSNGTQGTSYGASSINLRYLGGAEGSGNRVLVLVDGHRWVDGVGQRGFRDFVDLNTMPFGMIEGIEVLKDGASAIYGADAIAGVVNIKTLRDFDGLRLNVKTATTSRNDGEQFSAVANWGKTFDRASLVVSASYIKENPIGTADRDLTISTLVPQLAPGISERGLFILPGLSANAYFGTPAGFGATATPLTARTLGAFGAGNLADDSFRTAVLPDDAFNTQAQGIYSVGPSERFGLYVRLGYELTDNLKLKVEALHTTRESNQLFSPVQLDIGGTAGTIRGFGIASSQAFNPFGTANGVPTANALAFSSTQAWRIRRVMSEVGNRNNIQKVTTARLAAGLEGNFKIGQNSWNWDGFISYSKNEIEAIGENGIQYDRLFLALGAPANCAAVQGCSPVNLFGPMTKEAADYIRFRSQEYNSNELKNVAFNITGDLFNLPAGPLSMAAGYEYRENKAVDIPDAEINATPRFIPAIYTTTTGQLRTPTRGQYALHEAYVEVSAPLLRDAPLAKSLDLSLAARYSDYDTVGSATTMKAGIGWRVIDDILIRGTYAQGFRAPSILELYQGGRETNFQAIDPCNGGAAVNPTRPGCVGVPSAYNQQNFLNGLIPGTISGNLTLAPETADTISYGFALKPRFLPGFSLTVDWFDITIADAIASQSATQILSLCATEGGVFCTLVTRDAGTGAVRSVLQGAQNLNEIQTSGYDATARYEMTTSIGRIAAVLDVSFLDSFATTSPNPAGGALILDERAGLGDRPRSTFPNWKGQTSLRWSDAAWNALWRGRYIGETTDAINTVKDSTTQAVFYHDIEIGYQLPWKNTSFSFAINNVSDEMPPLSYANAPINFDIYTYDVRGRSYSLRVGMQF